MADTINNLYSQDFSENIMSLAQQGASKLLPAVYLKNNVRGKVFYQDQIGEWSMTDKVGRNPITPQSDPNFSRRMAIMGAKHDAVMLDRSDDLKMMADPKSPCTMAAGGALGRMIDDVAIAALGGNAFTGETGTTSVALPASQTIVHGSAGLTFNKVKQAQRIFNDNDVELEDRFFVTSPQGIEDLLGEEKATSSDYASLNAIQSGSFAGNMWMGFNWIMSTRLPLVSTTRDCFAFNRHGICVGLAEEPFVRTTERPSHSYSWQIYYELNIGATRLEEERVVKVEITES